MRAIVRFALVAFIAISLAQAAEAKGGFSSSRGGGFSSRSYSPSRSYSAPRSYSRTTITRNYYGGGSGYYYHPYMAYPGFGMGYGYSNGLIQGLIIGDLMHPAGTVPYTYGGYDGNALLYPNGTVVNPQGYQVGTYANGQFAAVQNGSMVAQAAPFNAQQAQAAPTNAQQAPAQPVVVISNGPSFGQTLLSLLGWLAEIIAAILGACLIVAFIGWLFGAADYTETETFTTEYEDDRALAGDLKRKRENGQWYVIDPADRSKVWVNDKDDRYEDANDRVWRLV